jgi:hypothetical protein
MTAIARADWRPYPVDDLLAMLLVPGRGAGTIVLTISRGQTAEAVHRVGYDDGAYILELDADEQPVAAYHRGAVS